MYVRKYVCMNIQGKYNTYVNTKIQTYIRKKTINFEIDQVGL